jgi:hypothetical protein
MKTAIRPVLAMLSHLCYRTEDGSVAAGTKGGKDANPRPGRAWPVTPRDPDCTLDEIAERFGRDRWVEDKMRPCRSRLFARLCDYLTAFRRLGLPATVLVNGSFTTDKPEPEDIDLAVVLAADHDFTGDLRPHEYNLLSRRRVRQEKYPFDLFVVADGTSQYHAVVHLFHQVRDHPERRKGFLRVRP